MISSAWASARASMRLKASSSTVRAITADRATETARTTTRRMAPTLTVMRALIERRADMSRTRPIHSAPRPLTQSDVVASSTRVRHSAAAMKTRAIHNIRRGPRSVPHPSVPRARRPMPTHRKTTTGVSRASVRREPWRKAATATQTKPGTRTLRDFRPAPTRSGRVMTMAAPATITRKVANSTANRS